MKTGFIGLGIMGRPMVKNLINSGRTVLINDVNKEAEEELTTHGAIPVSLVEMAEQADNIILMLPNASIIKNVLFDKFSITSSNNINVKHIIDMSSINPDESIEFNKLLQEYGVEYVDAPVSGGEPLAITGELSIMVGCNENTIEQVKEITQPFASTIIRVGEVGSGSVVKLANQIIVNTNIIALAEAVTLAKKFNIDLEKMHEAIRNGLAGSTVMEAKFPKMIQEDFKPGGTLNINLKDLKNVTSTADNLGISLPIVNTVKELYKSEVARGNGLNDHSGILNFYNLTNGE